jgi:acyl-CoA thioesterase FadM
MGTKSYTIGHEIIKPDGSIAVDGEAVSVIMDMVQRIAIPVPESICRYFPSRT